MKIFLSWSGPKARLIAAAMKIFLQDVNQRAIVWFSDSDISAGERWGLQLTDELENTNYGIICVTQDSMTSPWVLFEAGALAKSVGSRVCPYLIDVSLSQLPGPLRQFQGKVADKDGTWDLLQAINHLMEGDALPDARLERYFNNYWPNLAAEISRVNEYLKLPQELRAEMLGILPGELYEVNAAAMVARQADLPVSEINWNQAPVRIWAEIIEAAVKKKKLAELMDSIDFIMGPHVKIRELSSKVRAWSESQYA